MWNQLREVKHTKEWYKGVWFPQATPKYSFIVWLATHNGLSTGDCMSMWNGGGNFSCVFCNHHLESRDHLFFTCIFTSPIWFKLSQGITKQRHVTLFEDILLLISGAFKHTHLFFLRYLFQVAIY